MANPLFKPYRFEHPKTEQSILVGGKSYLWAGLFGAFWVASQGVRNKFPYAFAINICVWGAMIAGTGVALFLPSVQSIVLFIGACVVLLVVQSRMMVRIVRDHYRRRGWLVRMGV